MKTIKVSLLIAIILLCWSTGIAQRRVVKVKPVVETAAGYKLSIPIRDIPATLPDPESNKKERNEELKQRIYPYAATALPKGPDAVWQKENGRVQQTKAPVQNFEGVGNLFGGSPPDTDGEVGPNHYVQMINVSFQVFDKSGNSLYGPAANNTITGGSTNDGDPVILYDEQADRWLATQFDVSSNPNAILMAVSQTNDPTGSWHQFSFEWNSMPDYPKFGIWEDGYYMGANASGNSIAVFERSKMLAGDASAKVVKFQNNQTPNSGFHCVMPLDNDGAWSPSGTPGSFITINDDAWGGSDELRIWELDVDWNNTSNSTFTLTQSIPVSPFDANFGTSWENIPQPGTSQKVDAISQVLMFRAQYRNFGTHQTIVCNHTVDVNGSDHAGIRWYELRKTGGSWTLRQQSTYAPDSDNRWMGSIAMNSNGDIGLGYSVSSSSTYPSIRYCGQSAGENANASGLMDIAEGTIIAGTGSQTGSERWGDYSCLSVDPSDDNTFWFTTEYVETTGGSNWQTRIASFQFAPAGLNAEFSGTPANICTGGSASFTDQSTGSPISWEWSFPGGTPSSFTGQNPPAVVYNISGTYNVELTVGDGITTDTETKAGFITVNNILANFIGEPTTVVAGNPVTFIDNSSCNPTSWTWSFPGGTPASFDGQNPPAISYNTVGSFDVSLTVSNVSGSNTNTKTAYITAGNCTYCESTFATDEEYITNVTFNTINNSSSFNPNGYGDYTAQSTNIEIGSSHTLSVSFSSAGFEEFARAWFDWNQDCDFDDAGEAFDPGSGADATLTASINVPAGAATGQTRMRVSIEWDSYPDPCNPHSDYGETEDYTINISSGAPVPPTCTTPVFPLDATTGVGVSPNLTWVAAAEATGYSIYFGTNNPPTNIENGTDLGNVTSFTPSSNLNAGTIYYWKIIPYNVSGSATACPVWSFTTEYSSSTYCNAGSGNCDEFIEKVTVGSIDNPSTCSPGGYHNYTNLHTIIEIGSGYPVSVTNGNVSYTNDQCGIWVDWNNDFDFEDADEQIVVSGTPGTGPYNATITPPAGTLLGDVRMRIRITRDGAVTPCGINGYGEVEDYLLRIYPANWSFVPTPDTHLITVPFDVALPGISLSDGDLIVIFYSDELDNEACGGAGIWDDTKNLLVTAYGDDVTTPLVKDGFANSEALAWKVYYEASGTGEYVEVEYEQGFPNNDGTFVSGGISALASITSQITCYDLPIMGGWSGISSYMVPSDPDLENMFSEISGSFSIMYNFDGTYWPDQGMNTLVDWDVNSGYVIKLMTGEFLQICGEEVANKTVDLNINWNLVPVLSSSNHNVESLFAGLNGLVVVKGIGSDGVYWPYFDVNTFGAFESGKAYFVNMSSAGSITYPSDGDNTIQEKPFEFENVSPWNDILHTAGTHVVAFTREAALVFESGDIIGAFTQTGLCAGMMEYHKDATALVLNGDDVYTSAVDGFVSDENFNFKIYRPSSHQVFELEVEYEQLKAGNSSTENQGSFLANGLSAVKEVKLLPLSISDLHLSDINIHPNPTTGTIYINGIGQESEITIFNSLGRKVYYNYMSSPVKIDLNGKPSGIYIVKISNTLGIYFDKVVIE